MTSTPTDNPTRARALALAGAGIATGFALPARAQTLLPIRIGTSLSDPFLEPFYAQEKGFFKDAGLTADVQSLFNGSAELAAIQGGSLDIGNTDLIVLANAFNRGVDVGVVASGAAYNADMPTISLCVNKTSAYHTAKDLEGQTIAVTSLKSSATSSVSEWLVRGGADFTKVSFIEMLFPQMGPALASGRVAAALSGEPFLTDEKDDIRRLSDPYTYISRKFYTGVWYGKRSWLNANPATAKAFVSALYASARWANAHQADSAVIAARINHLDVAKVRSFVRNTFATSLEPRYAQPPLDLGYKYKVIEKPVAASDLFWNPPLP
jgi:NitT/TauT family transport system substrate-binding protein